MPLRPLMGNDQKVEFHEIKIQLFHEIELLLIKLSNINEQICTHEQIEFRPHDQKFNLLKKLNFDLMKFDLLTPTPINSIEQLQKYLKILRGSTS